MSNNEAGRNYSPPNASAGVDLQPRVEQRNLNQEAVSGFKNLLQLVKNTREILQLTRQSWSSLASDEQVQIAADLEENLRNLIRIARALHRTAALRPQIGLSQHLERVDEAIRLVGDQVFSFKRMAAASARAAARPPEFTPPPVAPASLRPATPRSVSPPVSPPPREAARARSGFEPTDTSPEAEEAWSSLKALFINLKDDRATKFHDVVNAHLKSMPSETAVQKYEKKRAEKKWKHIFDLWDGLKLGVSKNDDLLKLLWVDAGQSRKAAFSKLEKENILDFCDFPEVRPIIRRAEHNMANLRIKYLRIDMNTGELIKDPVYWDFAGQGDPSSVEVENSLVVSIDDRSVLSDEELLQIRARISRVADPKRAVTELMAIKSSMPRKSALLSVPKFQQLLRLDIKMGKIKAGQADIERAIARGVIDRNGVETVDNINKRIEQTPSSVLGAVFGAIVIGELRFKYFERRYRNYTASPVGFDPTPVTRIFPHSRVTYNVRAKGNIPPDHMQIFRTIRAHPDSIPESERISILDYYERYGSNPVRGLRAVPNEKRLDSLPRTIARVKKFLIEREVRNARRRREANYPLMKKPPARDSLSFYKYQPEYIALPTTQSSGGGLKTKADAERGRRTDNLINAYLVRNWLDIDETASDYMFAPIQLEPHHWLALPPLWDVLSSNEYNLTVETYLAAFEDWGNFHQHMEKDHLIKGDVANIGVEIRTAVDLLSKYKGMFAVFSGRQREVVLGVVAQLFLRMFKDLYDQVSQQAPEFLISFKNLVGGEDLTTREAYVQSVVDIIDQAETLDAPIRIWLLKILLQSVGDSYDDSDYADQEDEVLSESGRLDRLRGKVKRIRAKTRSVIKFGFFSGERGFVDEFAGGKENTIRKRIRNRVLQQPVTEDEKKGK